MTGFLFWTAIPIIITFIISRVFDHILDKWIQLLLDWLKITIHPEIHILVGEGSGSKYDLASHTLSLQKNNQFYSFPCEMMFEPDEKIAKRLGTTTLALRGDAGSSTIKFAEPSKRTRQEDTYPIDPKLFKNPSSLKFILVIHPNRKGVLNEQLNLELIFSKRRICPPYLRPKILFQSYDISRKKPRIKLE